MEPTSLRRRVSCSLKPQTKPRATRALCVCSAKIALRAFLKPAPSVLQQKLCTHRDNPHNEIDLGRICSRTLTHTHTHSHTHTHTAPLFDSLSFTARAPAEDTLTARTDVAARQLRARQPVRAASPETQDALGLLRLRTLVGFYAPNHKGDFKCAPLQCGARTHSPAAANTQRTTYSNDEGVAPRHGAAAARKWSEDSRAMQCARKVSQDHKPATAKKETYRRAGLRTSDFNASGWPTRAVC